MIKELGYFDINSSLCIPTVCSSGAGLAFIVFKTGEKSGRLFSLCRTPFKLFVKIYPLNILSLGWWCDISFCKMILEHVNRLSIFSILSNWFSSIFLWSDYNLLTRWNGGWQKCFDHLFCVSTIAANNKLEISEYFVLHLFNCGFDELDKRVNLF